MASIQPRGDKFQLRVKHTLLPKPFFFTFPTEIEARSYGAQLEALLARGIVPQELLTPTQTPGDFLLLEVVRAYTQQSAVLTDSDDALLDVVLQDQPVVGLRLSMLTFRWVEGYVKWLKSPEMHLVPSTIRKRIGVLGRVLDWHINSTTLDGATPLANPLRLLPRGYSSYSKTDSELVEAKRDVARDQRLSASDDLRIRAALAGIKREGRERALLEDPAFTLLYSVIVDTGLRLFEAFRLRADMIDLQRNIINVEGSKGHRGASKPRVVPIKPSLREPLRAWCAGRVGLIFPFWDGSKEQRPKTTSKLSARFKTLFEFATVPNFTEHDLRHEATCRWFELRNERGWMFSELEICRIMGWSDTKMVLRYASLRGEDLSARFG
jgi:integrase